MQSLDTLRINRRIDALLAPWAGKPVPGVTIGIVQDRRLTVHRSAGLASLELGVPIGPDTVFRIASVSKQFTCAAILMLVAEGRLRLDDRASDHVPGLPDLGVSIRHLMHNTSGIRDMLEIMRQGGADLGVPVRPDDLMDAVLRQRTLNFEPNTAFLYSNSNFLLLGRIAERVSGEALGALLDRRIFAPLGMTRTRLVERVGEPVPGLATGYVPDGESYIRAPHAFPLHGEGGLASCVEDLALWSHHLDNEGAQLAEQLAEILPFANGEDNFYARGQTVRFRRGVETVSHGGIWPGYKTEFLRAPGLGVTVIAISNNGAADPNALGLEVLDALLDARSGTPAAPKRPAPAVAAHFTGCWVSPDRASTLDGAIENGALVLRTNGVPAPVAVIDDGWVGTVHGSTALAVRPVGPDKIEVERSAGQRSTWRRAQPGELPAGLAGTYESAEMAARWVVTEAPSGWSVHATGPIVAASIAWPVTPIEDGLFRVTIPGVLMQSWLDVRAVIEEGRVTGLLVNGGRARNVRYSRVG